MLPSSFQVGRDSDGEATGLGSASLTGNRGFVEGTGAASVEIALKKSITRKKGKSRTVGYSVHVFRLGKTSRLDITSRLVPW